MVGYSGSKNEKAINPTYQNIQDCKCHTRIPPCRKAPIVDWSTVLFLVYFVIIANLMPLLLDLHLCFAIVILDAESMRVTFDSSKISYADLLDLFFDVHTPADPRWAGTQYRSAIFVYTPEQRQLAQQAVQSRGALGKMVAIEDASDFYRAEEYHQKYLEKLTGSWNNRNVDEASEESFWI